MPDRSNRHTDPPRRRFGARRGRLFTAVVGTLTLVASSATAVFATAPVSAAPAMPLAAAAAPPQAPVVLYTENFEHGVDDTPIVLTDYTGAPPINMTYTADPVWLTACNGAVLDFNAPDSAIANPPINQCGAPASTPTNYGKLRQLAWALGQFKGSATPGTNHAVAAYTAADPGAGKVQFATVDQIPLSSANGRFITFGVDTAAVNCNVSAPLYNFSLISADDTATPVGGVVNACTSTQTIDIPAVGAVPATQARVGTYTSDGSVLMTGSSLGIRMTNANGSGTGNDASFDNIQVLDATPKLDKEFSPSTIQAGQTSTLTFTVTNTSELAAKNGWSFTDNLPDGLVLASPTAAATDCPQGNVTATAGGTTVEVEGNLAAGMSSCTATVKVKAAEPGQYTNGPSNVTATGLDKPADTTLTVTEPGPPVFFGCSNLVTFDNDNSGWRAATTTNGTNVVLAPQPVGWSATEGNPGGAVKSDDLDGNWTELWTPDLAAGGYTTDYSFAVGSTLQFDYKNNTGIDVDVYMTVAGANGTSYFYNFRGQITDSTKWNHIRVPMDAAQWHTGFNNGTGPVGPAPTDTEFAAALADVDHFAFSVEGQVGPDTTLFDNFGQACDDYGDAPDSYGTTAAAGGPAHRLVDYNANAHTAPVMLGAHVSLDNDGQPGAAADGDTYDDGVTFNPALGGSTPIVLAGPVTNHLTVNASKAGFVSVWVDWNGDGDFDDAGEQTVNAHAVTAGDNDVTFDGADINSDLNSYVRVRYSTDAAAVAAPTGSAPDGEVEDYAVQVQARAYTVTKKADKTVAHPGDKVTYTVTVTNTSQADYTDANPATFSDDLSGVLDDAVYNDDAAASAGTAGYTAPTLTWSGALAAGGSVTVTYSVTVNTPDTGDKNLTNAALPTGPGGQCTDGSAPPCDANVVPVQAFTVTKKADKTVAHPGDKVTYTVTVTNTGAADYTDADPASFSDDLSGVLDDAVYNDDAAASAGTAGYTAPTLTWSGALAPNASATVTYSVTVNTPDAGDNKLTNAALPPPGTGGLCADGSAAPCDPNVVPVQAFTVTKQADKTVAHPGDVLTYTVTVTNTGQVAYTDGDPASFTDDLSAVLDDAVYNNDAVASAGTASYAEPTVSWSGALAIGASVTVTYTVTVDTPDAGDHLLTNAATPAPGIGGGCADGSAAPCDPNVVPVQSFTVAKVSDKTVITRGDKVTYTVTVTNTGQVAYTDGDPASFTDDLSAVLDDAVYNNDAVASAGTASYAEPTVSWSGALAIGASVTVTYSATVNTPDTGDNKLTNAAVPSAPGGGCADGSAAPCDPVVVPVKALDITKVADRNKVNPGDKVTYTVTVVNTGQVDYTAQDLASFTDDLSAVLDDATYNNDATASAGTVSYAAPTVSWSGELAVGATVTITYSARVNDPYTGDKKMDNTVITPAAGGGNCADASTDPRCTARVPGVQLTVAKAASSASAAPGKKITYTVTVTNSGQAEFTDQDQAWITDDLSGVLDDATYARDAKASSGEISYDAPKLTWSGALAVGASVTITYSVRVNDPDSGDRNLHNVVIVPPDMSSNCAAGSTDSLCSTNTTVTVPPKPPLAYTGTNAGQQLTIAALLLGFGGLFLVVGRRRRRRTDLG